MAILSQILVAAFIGALIAGPMIWALGLWPTSPPAIEVAATVIGIEVASAIVAMLLTSVTSSGVPFVGALFVVRVAPYAVLDRRANGRVQLARVAGAVTFHSVAAVILWILRSVVALSRVDF